MPTMQNLSAKNLLQLCQQGIAVMLMLSLAASSWADLDTIIIDEKGRYLYRSRGIGYGQSSRFALDYRKESLKKGLSEALQSLNEVEVEPITNKD